jgi:hypothetical protein
VSSYKSRTARLACAGIFALASLLLASCGHSLPGSLTAPRVRQDRPQIGAGGGGAHDIEGQVMVTLIAGVDPASIAADHGATLVEYEADERVASFLPGALQTPAALLEALTADGRILTSEPNSWLETAETRQSSFAFDDGANTPQTFIEQPSRQAIRLEEAHEVAFGAGVTVAILDTGIDPRHPLLRHAYAGGWDFVDHDADPTELRDGFDDDGDGNIDEAFGHGTHVAGIVHMVAPEARLLALRVLDADGRGDVVQIAAGVRWAVAHGAKVINLSLGTLSSSDALQHSLGDAENAGVIVITSAGNWGAETPVEFPARSSHVAAVAAVDANAEPALFSSFGHIVALSAPGVGVRSTYPGGGYRLWSGTSMAAPFVAGTAALLAEVHPDWTLRPMMLRMMDTASPVASQGDAFGAGALDAGAALAPDRRSHVDDEPVPLVLVPSVGRTR